MIAPAIFAAVAALIAGLVVGYLLAAAHARPASETKLREAESGRAGLEATVSELRRQLEALQAGRAELQSRLETEQQQRAGALTALEESRKNLEEQRQALEQTKADMKTVFQALASETLSQTTAQFLKLAETKFEGLHQGASAELDMRRVAIEGLVRPLSEALQNLQNQVTRVSQTGTVLSERVVELQRETGTLSTALRQPRVRGSWGELTLRRAIELAGMSAHCDFEEQLTIVGAEGNLLRPDVVIHLPGGSDVAVDAKVPLTAFLEAAEDPNEPARQEAMRRHVLLVRDHIRQLSSKAYWSELPSAAELVILFMPGESFFSAAIEQDRSMIEDALAHKVLLASPTTLIAALRSFALDWRQHDVEKNAAQISELGKELYARIEKFIEHIGSVRDGLERASRAYNSAVGSFNDRLLPSARRLRELGASADAELPALDPTETELRLPPRSGAEPPAG